MLENLPSSTRLPSHGTLPFGLHLPRHAELWMAGYARNRARHYSQGRKLKRLWVAITDHYEPLGGAASLEKARSRVGRWQDCWPRIAYGAEPDSQGRPPCYTFFYPQEDYRSDLLEPLAEMTRSGIGDVEVHIHHDHDTPEAFREKIRTYCRRLRDNHGLLNERDGEMVFGFIHGNWALDNSRPDGRWCGVQGEIEELRNLGCYADFTMPSLPSATQGRVINQIYWCSGIPGRTKAFDRGIEAARGEGVQGDLLMITGPLGLRYRERGIPRMETGEIAAYDPPTRYRVKRWLDLAPRLGDDAFLKLYTHGAPEANAGMLLGGGLEDLFRWLHEASVEQDIELHWASAFDMYCAIRALTDDSETVPPTPRRIAS